LDLSGNDLDGCREESSRRTICALMLGLKFAYATNGPEIIEFDYFTGSNPA
jgi:hypothetical protein